MYEIRDVVFQEIEERFNPFQIQKVGESKFEPSIEIMSKPGLPVITVDFGETVEVYRTTDPDDVVSLAIEDPSFNDSLAEALDYFYVPRR